MITSFKTKLMFVALALLALSQPAFAQRGGVPLLGYYRPCILKSQVEKAEIIKPEFERTVMIYAQIVYPQFDTAVVERPQMELPKFLVPKMVRPEYVDPCLPVYSAAFSAALARSAVALGVKFDSEGRIASRPANDLNAAAMMPAGVAATMVSHNDASRKLTAPAVNTACCGGAPATGQPSYTGIRVRTRE